MCANARGHVAITHYVAGTIDVAVVARLLGPSQSPPADPLKQLAASIVSPKYLYTLRLPSTLHTGMPTGYAARWVHRAFWDSYVFLQDLSLGDMKLASPLKTHSFLMRERTLGAECPASSLTVQRRDRWPDDNKMKNIPFYRIKCFKTEIVKGLFFQFSLVTVLANDRPTVLKIYTSLSTKSQCFQMGSTPSPKPDFLHMVCNSVGISDYEEPLK